MNASLPTLMSEVRRLGFDHLSDAERSLLEDFAGSSEMYETHPSPPGSTAPRSTEQPQADKATEHGSDWGREREVRGALLRMLCLNKTARATGGPIGISLEKARIIGTLDLQLIAVPFPLIFRNCYFDNVSNFYAAQVPYLEMSDCFAPGLVGELLLVKSHLNMDGFHSQGEEIGLRVCHITGNLSCIGARFSNPPQNDSSGKLRDTSGAALVADGAVVDGYVLLRSDQNKSFHSIGKVSLLGAQVRGDLDCSGATFEYNPDNPSDHRDDALDAERINVKGTVYLSNGFHALGQVRLMDCQIGGSLICEGALFENKFEKSDGPRALDVERGIIAGTARLAKDDQQRICKVTGIVSFLDARLSGALVTDFADLREAVVELRGATTSGFSDAGDQSWPNRNKLYLKRFAYGAILGGTEDAKDRLFWLGLQPDDDFNTESYAQLAKVFQQAGDDDGARLVLRRLSELQEKHDHRFWYLRPQFWLRAAIGYGYRPILAVWYSLVLGVIGWIIYRRSYLAGSLVPRDKDAYGKLKDDGVLPSYYPRFYPLVMSVENSLPLVKLGQTDKWQPDPGEPTVGRRYEEERAILPKWTRAQVFLPLRRICSEVLLQTGLRPGPTGMSIETPLSRFATSPKCVRRFIWVQILLGWLFATLFVAGVTGLIKR